MSIPQSQLAYIPLFSYPNFLKTIEASLQLARSKLSIASRSDLWRHTFYMGIRTIVPREGIVERESLERSLWSCATPSVDRASGAA